MIFASDISNIGFLPSDPNELCERLKLLLQEEKQATIQIKLMKSLLWLINYWNTNEFLKNNINKF